MSDYAVVNPATGETLATYPTATDAEVDAAIAAADTLMLTIPSQLGVEFNLRVVESFAKYVAPELGWRSTRA